MFGYAGDVLARVDMTEEQHAQFAEFCDSAVVAVAWTTPISTDDGDVYSRDGELYETAYETPEWDWGVDDVHDIVLTANIEEWLGFFVENYDDLLACSADFGRHGHDYVLTAGYNGAGFWDRGYPKAISDRLCDSAHGGTSSHSFWFESDDDGEEVLRYEQA